MQWFCESIKDKLGNYSGRELTGFISVVALLVILAADITGYATVSDALVYTFGGFVTAGILGYSLEKPNA